MTRKLYSTDLTDEQWSLIEPLLPAAKPGGGYAFSQADRWVFNSMVLFPS